MAAASMDAPPTGARATADRGLPAAPACTMAQALKVSEALLDAARAGRWDEVETLRPGRDAAIRWVLSEANPDYPYAIDMDAVMRLATLDREIVAVARAERDASRERVEEARRAGRMRKAYGG